MRCHLSYLEAKHDLDTLDAERAPDVQGREAWWGKWRRQPGEPWRYIVNSNGRRVVYTSISAACAAARWLRDIHQ